MNGTVMMAEAGVNHNGDLKLTRQIGMPILFEK